LLVTGIHEGIEAHLNDLPRRETLAHQSQVLFQTTAPKRIELGKVLDDQTVSDLHPQCMFVFLQSPAQRQ
jgi:hypothetical protein